MRFLGATLALLAGTFVVWPTQIAGGPAVAAEAQAPRERPLVAVIDSGVARTSELSDFLVGEFDMAANPSRPAV